MRYAFIKGQHQQFNVRSMCSMLTVYPSEMLDGTGDAAGDVEIRGRDLAGLSDLIVVGHIACAHDGARSTDGVELLCHSLQHFEVFTIQRAATACSGPWNMWKTQSRHCQETELRHYNAKQKAPNSQDDVMAKHKVYIAFPFW